MNSTTNICCKTSLFFNAFRLTVVDLLGSFAGLTLDACIYISHTMAVTGANDHIASAGLTEQNQTKLSKNSKIF